MLLAAHDQGLGAVWIGIYPAEKLVTGIRDLLNIPEQMIPFSAIAIGHPAEEKKQEDQGMKSQEFTTIYGKASQNTG